jgi:type I restriction enzyme R subunit
MTEYKPIAESNNFIILERFPREWTVSESYQSENELERELITDLQNQGLKFAQSQPSLITLLEAGQAKSSG